jgi:subtilisin family serine protease
MRLARLAVVALASLTFGLLPSTAVAAAPQSPSGNYVDGSVLVGFQPATSGQEMADAEQSVGAAGHETIGAGTHRLKVKRGTVPAGIAALKKRASVRYAEPDFILHANLVPNDPRFAELWGMRNTGQPILGTSGTAGADIHAVPAWDISTGSPNVVVGIVDTGIDYTHPDLAANVWSNPGGIGGCAAGTHGFNAITRTCDPRDDNNHGSHVSGTIGAAGNNSVGVVGINWTTTLMGLKFLDSSGSGTTADAITAIDFAVQAKIAGVNIRVLSNSWGGGGFSQALLDEINKANTNDIMFVAAAGNSASNNDTTPAYPASYNAPNIVAVAATDQNDALASFSNFGPTSVHLGAPGVNVLSTIIGSNYDFFSGTSMATPHVSGSAALILSKCALNTAALKSQLLNNVDADPALAGITATGGRLDVDKAIRGCAGAPATPDFTLSSSPTSQTVVPGQTTSYTVTIAPTGGFTGAVTFSVTGLPTGATASFSPNPASGTTSTLTVTTSTSTPTGSFALTVTGASGSLTRTTSVTLVVASPDNCGNC